MSNLLEKLKFAIHSTLIFLVGIDRAPAQHTSPVASTISALEQSSPIERELRPGIKHSYLVDLKRDQTMQAGIDQLGVDVIVLVLAPDKSYLSEIDSPESDQGKELIEIHAKQSGIYRIQVSCLKKNAAAGKYRIQIEAITNL